MIESGLHGLPSSPPLTHSHAYVLCIITLLLITIYGTLAYLSWLYPFVSTKNFFQLLVLRGFANFKFLIMRNRNRKDPTMYRACAVFNFRFDVACSTSSVNNIFVNIYNLLSCTSWDETRRRRKKVISVLNSWSIRNVCVEFDDQNKCVTSVSVM